MLISISQSGEYPDCTGLGGLQEVVIEGVEYLDYPSVKKLVLELFSGLQPGARLEFILDDLQYFLAYYTANRVVDEVFTSNVFNGRRSMWDELSIAEMLLVSGFPKVWTGRVEGLPDTKFLVKAIR